MRKYIILSLATSAIVLGSNLVAMNVLADTAPAMTGSMPSLPVEPTTDVDKEYLNGHEADKQEEKVQKHHEKKTKHKMKKEEEKTGTIKTPATGEPVTAPVKQ